MNASARSHVQAACNEVELRAWIDDTDGDACSAEGAVSHEPRAVE